MKIQLLILCFLTIAILSNAQKPDCKLGVSDKEDIKMTYTSLDSPIAIVKVIDKVKRDTSIMVRVELVDKFGVTEGKGVKILFDDGKLLKFDEPIQISKSDDGYHYRASIILPKYKITDFLGRKVALIEMYIIKKDIDNLIASKFEEENWCILIAK